MLRPGEPICPEGYPSPNTILALSVLFHNQYLTRNNIMTYSNFA